MNYPQTLIISVFCRSLLGCVLVTRREPKWWTVHVDGTVGNSAVLQFNRHVYRELWVNVLYIYIKTSTLYWVDGSWILWHVTSFCYLIRLTSLLAESSHMSHLPNNSKNSIVLELYHFWFCISHFPLVIIYVVGGSYL